jgi:hypothetical protein
MVSVLLAYDWDEAEVRRGLSTFAVFAHNLHTSIFPSCFASLTHE